MHIYICVFRKYSNYVQCAHLAFWLIIYAFYLLLSELYFSLYTQKLCHVHVARATVTLFLC